ncbi:MAG: oligosaccharide flippase family protein [Candidatus Omnitrophica bacterium]|nr:oligosaccharide flippase family protein [Candidatus Omnitrophota bacterium]
MIFKLFKKLLISYTAKDLYYVSTGNLIIIITGFIFTVLVARNLTPEYFGVFSAVASLTLIFSDMGDLGIGGGLANFLPPLIQKNDHLSVAKIIKTTLFLQLSSALIIYLIFFFFSKDIAFLILQSQSIDSIYFVRLAAIGVILFMLFNFFNSVLGAKEQFRKTFWLMFSYSIPRLLILLLISLFINLDTAKTLLIFFVGPLIGCIIGALMVNLNFIKAKGFYPIKKIFNFSIFLLMNKIFVSLFSRLDIIMLTSLASSYAAGIYSAASRVALIYPLIGGSLATVLAPRYARFSKIEAITYTKKVFLLISGLVLSLLLLMSFSPFLINLIYGREYSDAGVVLTVLLLSMSPFLLAIPTNNLLTYTIKKPQVIASSSLIQLIIIFFLNILLIPKLGSLAPAVSVGIASLTAMLISFTAVAYFLKKT